MNIITVVIGASPNVHRYSNRAVNLLVDHDFKVIPLGIRKGQIAGIDIINIRERPRLENVHTITLYINPGNQVEWYEYIKSLNPERVIFNPGTENTEFENQLNHRDVDTIRSCTLVMLNSGIYREVTG